MFTSVGGAATALKDQGLINGSGSGKKASLETHKQPRQGTWSVPAASCTPL